MERHFNYEKLDEILVEPCLISLAEENKLKDINIIRRRWGNSDILLNWKEKSLNKNIHIIVVKDNQIRIECNAWKDKNYKEGNKMINVRKWKHQNICQLDISSIDKFKKLLKVAYKTVAKWNEKYLKNEEPISYFI